MNRITVGISDLKICRAPDGLVTYALGSCVGVCLADTAAGVAGMAHFMLPDSREVPGDANRLKFADTAIHLLYDGMMEAGADKDRLTAKIAGGADMFRGMGLLADIGARNTAAAKEMLRRLGVPLIAEDTGADYGRTVTFDAKTGIMTVSTGLKGTKII